jgi:hypothetical protein
MMSDDARADLNLAISKATVSKSLNEMETAKVVYSLLKTRRLNIPTNGALVGSAQEISFKLALNSVETLESRSRFIQSIVDAVKESCLCRKTDKKREVRYGNGMSYLDSLPVVYNEVVLAGRIVGNGGEVSLEVGNLYFRLSKEDLRMLGIDRDDFLWFNRPYTGDLKTNASRTSGTLQYTLVFGDTIRVSGLRVPSITQRSMKSDGANGKSMEKTAYDLRKRQKNR